MRNIEIKARLRDLAAARRTAETLADQRLGVQEQVDTYFYCPHGRLKLRQIAGQEAELIFYERAADPRPKASDYQIVRLPQGEAMLEFLRAALGVVKTVRKRREIFLHGNVRIHLDEVDGLGQFLEFEAVLSSEIDDSAGRRQLASLLAEFNIRPDDLLAGSYADMLPERNQNWPDSCQP